MKNDLLTVHRLLLGAVLLLMVLIPLRAVAQDTRQLTREETDKRRIALVIGNGNYSYARKLANPVNDASDVSRALVKLGFEVISATDADLRGMTEKIREFGDRLRVSKGIGLFYYAGHGVQVRGSNYLVPVDADIPREDEVRFAAVNLDLVLAKMDAANNGLNIVVLDACRNNPFARGWSRGVDEGGLAQVTAPTGTFIAYATAPNTTASDGTGRNGLYTSALLKELATPGLKIEDLFKRVTIDVDRSSGGKQTPWTSSSLRGDFYFAGAGPVMPSGETAPPEPSEIERQAWSLVRNSSDTKDIEVFLSEFPDGAFAPLARVKLTQMKNGPVPADPAVPKKGALRKNDAGMEFVYVPPGSFSNGKVSIVYGYWIGRYEVTQDQWTTLMGSNPSRFQDCGGSCPVDSVSWIDAQEFVLKLNERNDGFVYRLPSENEWELAARGSADAPVFRDLLDEGWFSENAQGRTHPVGQKTANALGIYDMVGNVWEYVLDSLRNNAEEVSNDGSPNLKGSTAHKVMRGGAWYIGGGNASRAIWQGTETVGAGSGNGLRVVARPVSEIKAGTWEAYSETDIEEEYWAWVSWAPSEAAIKGYLKRWPEGKHASEANKRLEGGKFIKIPVWPPPGKTPTPEKKTAKIVLPEGVDLDSVLEVVRSAEEAEKTAHALLEQAQQDRDRTKTLISAGATTVRAYEAASKRAQNANAELSSRQKQLRAARAKYEELLTHSQMDFVWVSPGEFLMGTSQKEADTIQAGFSQAILVQLKDEMPQRKVKITKGFWMGAYEVTQDQYRAVMGTNPSKFTDCGGTCPVEQVSWNDAQEFIRLLNAASTDGSVFRLATEAEWEFAARAGTTGEYAGDVLEMGWIRENSGDAPHPVGTKAPNAWGLYDMHGNVWEWGQDWYKNGYEGAGESDPSGPAEETRLGTKVARGGGWYGPMLNARSAARSNWAPDTNNPYVGFRIVKEAKP